MSFFKSYIKLKVILLLWLLILTGISQADDRQTRILTLSNGLDVLLEYDPEVHRSAASLAVGTGHLYDPKDKMGLAHYLEHMLFLGTKKYPEVDDYKKYLNENSGGSNAYTASEITNYFFQVSHEAFDGALDRFSQFFKEPLFNPTYAEREVNAVSSEHDKNKLNDGWRGSFVKGLVSEPGHPLSNFGTGNKSTLAGDNRPVLKKFYETYYSAGNMKLAMLSSLPLNEQEALVRKHFADIPRFEFSLPEIDSNFRRPLEGKYRLLKIKTIKDIRQMSLEFPTIHLIDHQGSKPASIIGSILGYEGKGSLLSKLKEEGLALGLSAGGGYSHPNINSMTFSVSLTKKGVAEYEKILELIFSYIDRVRKRGIEEYTFKENQAMAQIDFDWKDKDEGMGYVAGKSALMFDFKLEDVETLPYLFKKYDPQAYSAVLDTLTPENMLVVLQTNSEAVDQKAPFYDAEYSLAEVGGEAFKKLARPAKISGISYPAPNKFIPYNLKLYDEDPHLVWNNPLGKVYFKFDHRFNQPKAFMKLQIETPRVYDTVENYVRAKLYAAAVSESLNEEVYPIQLSGLSYGLGLEKKGVVFTVGGYSERISDLANLAASNLMNPNIDEQKFANIKEAMLRGYENRKLGQAYARGSYYSGLIWKKKQYREEDIVKALKPVTLQDVRDFAKSLYQRVHVTGMVYGNWTEEAIRKSLDNLFGKIKSGPLPEAERFEPKIEVLGSGRDVEFAQKVEDNNNSLAYAIQVGEKEFTRQVNASLVAAVIESDFYTQMRTNQQLGYLVWSFYRRLEDRIFLKFVIQSANHSPFELERRVEAWFKGAPALFENLSDADFEKHRESLLLKFKKKGETMGEDMGELYYLATQEDGDFAYKKKLIQATENTTKEAVQKLAQEIFNNPKTPRMAILMQSKKNEEAPPPNALREVSEVKALFN